MAVVTSARRRARHVGSRLARRVRTDPNLGRRILPWTERIQRVRARIRPRHSARPLDWVVSAYAAEVPDATFVQIGAHDGTQLDPLREAVLGAQWRGIMVEPVPYVFARLDARYRSNPRVMLENVAIAEANGLRPFHHLAEAPRGDQVWKWYDALGSFDRDVVLSHRDLVEDIDARLVTVDVSCVTFERLCVRRGLERVDLVQIDTEGHDRAVLELIDLERYGTDVVIFEHLHLDRADRDACAERLVAAGFEQLSDGMDTIAVTGRMLKRPGIRAAFERARAEMAEFEQ